MEKGDGKWREKKKKKKKMIFHCLVGGEKEEGRKGDGWSYLLGLNNFSHPNYWEENTK